MPLFLWVAGGALLLALVFVVFQHNRMVTLRNRCAESWADVDAELLRRHDLIPNLVQTVQASAAHERSIVAEVTTARAKAMAAGADPMARQGAEAALARSLSRLLAVAQAYPNLKASANFLALQQELATTEDRIQAARRFYNANVRDYRNQTRQMPGVLVARAFHFAEVPFFEVESVAVRNAPAVQVG